MLQIAPGALQRPADAASQRSRALAQAPRLNRSFWCRPGLAHAVDAPARHHRAMRRLLVACALAAGANEAPGAAREPSAVRPRSPRERLHDARL